MPHDRKNFRDKKSDELPDDHTLRHQPHSIEAEEGLLAACLIEGGREVLTECIEAKITADFFFKTQHQVIYQALIDLYDTGNPADEIILLEHLRSNGLDEEAGGIAGIYAIQDRIETPAHFRYFAKIVHEKHMLRQAIRLCRLTIEGCYEQQEDFRTIVGQAEQQLRAIAESEEVSGKGVVHSSEVVDRAVERLHRQLNNPGYKDERVVETHLRDLNGMLDQEGFGPGQQIILAARPSVGKSALMGNFCEHAGIEQKVGVLVFTFEMTAEEVINRLACSRARIDSRKLRRGEVGSADMKALADAYKAIKAAPIYIDDDSSNTILDIRAKALRKQRELERKGIRLGLVVADYLQLIQPTNRKIPRVEQVGEISRGGKQLAKELECPFVNLSQLNRESERDKREPRLSDLREAGDIEQDADTVLLLHRCPGSELDQSYNPDSEDIKVIIAKQRGGPVGDFMTTFHKRYTKFENHLGRY